MSTKTSYIRSGTLIQCDTSVLPRPTVQTAYPIPAFPTVANSFLTLSLQTVASTGRSAVQVVNSATLPGPVGTWTLYWLAYQGSMPTNPIWNAVSIPGNTINLLLDNTIMPSATFVAYLQQTLSNGQTFPYAQATISTPADTLQQAVLALATSSQLSPAQVAMAQADYNSLSQQVISLEAQTTQAGLSVSTYATLVTDLSALNTYLTGLTNWGSSTLNVTIVPSTWNTKWNTVFTDIANLETTIATAIATTISNMSTTITGYASSSQLSPAQVAIAQADYNSLVADQTTLQAQVVSVGLPTSTYSALTTDLSALNTYLTGLTNWGSGTLNVTIVPATWQTKWNAVFTDIATIKTAITTQLNTNTNSKASAGGQAFTGTITAPAVVTNGTSTSWGSNPTAGFQTIQGTTTSATWLTYGTSGGVFRGGIQLLDAGGSIRTYVGAAGGTIGSTLSFAELLTTGAFGVNGIAILNTSGQLTGTFNGASVTSSGAVVVTGSTGNVQGSIYYNATNGMSIWAKTGTTYDLMFPNAAGGIGWCMPTATSNFQCAGGGLFSGLSTFSAGLKLSGSVVAAAATIGLSSTTGLTIWANTGSVYDLALLNPGNSAYYLQVPTGTNIPVFPQGLTSNGNITLSGAGGGGAGSIYYNSVAGLSVCAKTGSSYDWSLINAANSAYALYMPTGTNNLVMPGTTNHAGLATFAGGISLAASQGMLISDGAPGVTTNKLYQAGSLPFWNGSQIITLGTLGSTFAGVQALQACLDAPTIGNWATFGALPATTSTTGIYPPGSYVYSTVIVDTAGDNTAGTLYQNVAGTWTRVGSGSVIAGKIVAANVSAGSIGASAIVANSITSAQINASSVQAAVLTAGSITTSMMTAGTINASVLTAGSITTSMMTAGTINASVLTTSSITATQIAANTITSAQLATTLATANIIQSSGTGGVYAAGVINGTTNAAPVGFKFSGTPYTANCFNGYTTGTVGSGPTQPSVTAEFGTGVSFGGYDLSTLAIGKLVNSGTIIYQTPGSYSWVCPPNITTVEVTLVGGGGSGAWYVSGTPGGGGGAGWVCYQATVVPGTTYTVVVGSGGAAATSGTNGSNGTLSSFNGYDGTATASPGLAGTNGGGGSGGAASCPYGSVAGQGAAALMGTATGPRIKGIGGGCIGGAGSINTNGWSFFNSSTSVYGAGPCSGGPGYGNGSGGKTTSIGSQSAGQNGMAMLKW